MVAPICRFSSTVLRDPETHDFESREPGNIAPLEQDLPASCARPAANRHQQRRFAGPVSANQGDDLTGPDFEIDPLKCFDVAIEGMDTRDRQHYRRIWRSAPVVSGS